MVSNVRDHAHNIFHDDLAMAFGKEKCIYLQGLIEGKAKTAAERMASPELQLLLSPRSPDPTDPVSMLPRSLFRNHSGKLKDFLRNPSLPWVSGFFLSAVRF